MCGERWGGGDVEGARDAGPRNPRRPHRPARSASSRTAGLSRCQPDNPTTSHHPRCAEESRLRTRASVFPAACVWMRRGCRARADARASAPTARRTCDGARRGVADERRWNCRQRLLASAGNETSHAEAVGAVDEGQLTQMSSSATALRGMHLPSPHRPVAHCSESVHAAPSATCAAHVFAVWSQ